VLRLDLRRELGDDRQHLLAVGDVQLPHQQVDRLAEPARLAKLAVVRRVPGLLDERLALVALDQDAALVVHLKVHRPDHAVAAALAQPALRGREQHVEGLLVVLDLEEAEHPPAVVVVGVEGVVDLGADPPDDATVAAGQEQLGLAVAEERVEPRREEQPALEPERGHPLLGGSMKPEREPDECAPVAPAPDRCHLHGHGGAP
jgi:hypothetical protein